MDIRSLNKLKFNIIHGEKFFGKWFTQRLYSTRDPVRVRFAPSPTGQLHVGGLRTALYNSLFAKQHGGKFILRIEDTDRTRFVPGAVDKLLQTLSWMGIEPDEGPHRKQGCFGPYVQSERLHLYQKYIKEMVNEGKAYYCFCTERRLALLKQEQQKRKEHIRYDNRCRNLTDEETQRKLKGGQPYVVRFKMDDTMVSVHDMLFGEVKDVVGSIEGDPVLMKSDGYPTYHFANVVDDHLMEISHVIRGKEWLISTGKHLKLYRALGWKPPEFMHLPLLVNENRSKLSKRQGDVFVEQFRDRGYTQSSLLNFVSSYGAGFPQLTFPVNTSNHHLLLDELTKHFTAEKLVVTDAFCDFARLDDYSFTLLRDRISNPDERNDLLKKLTELLKLHRPNSFVFQNKTDDVQAYLNTVLNNMKDRLTTLQGLCCDQEYSYLWERPVITFESNDEVLAPIAKDFIKIISEKDPDLSQIAKFIKKSAKMHKLNYGHCMQFIRYILIGSRRGAPIAELVETLGIEETVLRLNDSLVALGSNKISSVT